MRAALGAEAAIPAPRERDQPAVYEAAGKVFLGDVDVSVGPTVADLVEVGKEHVADDCGRTCTGEELLERLAVVSS
jgi:hypothetical protein